MFYPSVPPVPINVPLLTDTKVYNTITSDKDQNSLQTAIDKIKEWCDRWLLPLNIRKCCHI